MHLSGQTEVALSPDRAMAQLQDPAVLDVFMLGTSEIDQISPGDYGFTLRYRAGPVTLTLPGTLVVTVEDADQRCRFDARASHLIGGSATLCLDIAVEPSGQHSTLRWSGEMSATGLAGKLLASKADRVDRVAQNLMRALATRLTQIRPRRGR